MKKSNYKIKGKIWCGGYDSAALWHFVTVPKKETAQIKKDFGALSRGWQSLPVEVTVGKTTWQTSIFLDSKTQTYVLPIKAKVRQQEQAHEGDTVTLRFKIVV